MLRYRRRWAAGLALAFIIACSSCSSGTAGTRRFPDRPVAWTEHDDEDIPHAPKSRPDLDVTVEIRNGATRQINRWLALEPKIPAQDVNALDEVACSTWFCPKNHLVQVPTGQIPSDPAGAPVPPFTVIKGKEAGAAPGLQIRDAEGRRYLFKFDVAGHPAMATGAEIISSRLYAASGYNVPNIYSVVIAPEDLQVGSDATYLRHGFDKKPFGRADLDAFLAGIVRAPDGRVSAAAIQWLSPAIGPFDSMGRVGDDPNDRIPHERRRSLRAASVLAAWTANADAWDGNSLDVFVEDDGRHFVRHYLIDFGGSLGSWTIFPKTPMVGEEQVLPLQRFFAGLFSVGIWQRAWQHQHDEWEAQLQEHPSIGWFPSDDWDPTGWRPNRVVPAFVRMTRRDAYWGAKVVTSFTDQQITSAVAGAGYTQRDEAELARILEVRRDKIGHTWLAGMTAVERPESLDGGVGVCFQDLAVTRGYLAQESVSYRYRVDDGQRHVLSSGPARDLPDGAPGQRCVLFDGYRPDEMTNPYLRVRITSIVDGKALPSSYVHLSWRAPDGRWAVVGVDRDE
jgi:hypothetical protein